MINLVSIYDDLDHRRGEYFKASHDDILNKVNSCNIRLYSLDSSMCDQSIDYYIQNFNGQRFIFVAYVHGSEDALEVNGAQYINEINSYFFAETLFYACSCLSAKNLGEILRKEGCRVFIGYDSSISSVSPDYEHLFYECENAFLTHFLTTGSTIGECLEFMYSKYKEMLVFFSDNGAVFDAIVLENNLSAFKILCDSEDFNLRVDFFFI